MKAIELTARKKKIVLRFFQWQWILQRYFKIYLCSFY